MTPAHVRYEAGTASSEWLFVAGRSFVAAVQPGVTEEILDALWWLAEADFAEIESIVGAFPLRGDDEVSSFAIVSFGAVPPDRRDTLVTAVVRGRACVDVFSVGGARRFQADGVEPWLLADFRSVTGFSLTGDEEAAPANATVHARSLPLQTGMAEGRALAWSLDPIPRRDGAPEDATDSGARSAAAPASVPLSFEREGDPGQSDSGQSALAGAEDDRSWSVSRSGPPASVRNAGAASTAEVGSQVGTGSQAAAGSQAATRSQADEDLEDDTLILARRPLPPIPDGRDDDSDRRRGSHSDAAYTLRIGVSESIVLDQPTIIGRNPRSSGIPYGESARLLTVASPELEVSSSHVQIQQVGDAVVVTDLRSTNGTYIVREGLAAERLRPGESRVLAAGAALDIGDGNIIEIAHITPAH